MALFRTGIPQYHPLQGFCGFPFFLSSKCRWLPVAIPVCPTLPICRPMRTMFPFSRTIYLSAHTAWKSHPHAGFRRTSRNCRCTGLQRPSRFPKHRPACHKVRHIHSGMEYLFLSHRMHPYSETGREGKPPPALIQGEYNRIISQYGYRQPAVSYERFSLPGRMDTADNRH